MRTRPGQKLKLTSVEELLKVPTEEMATEIEINQIHSFKDHPFKVLDDDRMADLVESIKENGVLSPVLVRPDGEDSYEMISGHRRMHAAQLAGLEVIPAIIRELTDDEAVVYMVDSNIQREELLPSEKAFAYKMKMDAMKHQGERSDLTLGQNVPKFKRTTEAIAQGSGESYKQVQRYIRLTELIPELLDLVDNKRLQFTVAVEISYVDKAIQRWINEYIHENGCIKKEQIDALRQRMCAGAVTQEFVIEILNRYSTNRSFKKKVTLSENKLKRYFPPHYSALDMEAVILELLEEWREQNN
ncbi:MAG: ParB/RepB/Spo0J family partition protein [Lachnospiraceae bacterium]|nr:ParB/RepB/Spo0J family partition protein [Lachnospiraceae bacterium]